MRRRAKLLLYTMFTKNVSLKITAVVITLLLWFIVTSSRTVEMVKKVPINFITAQDLVVGVDTPRDADVRLTGPSAFMRKAMERPNVMNVDLRDKKPGFYVYKLNENQINLPLGVKVIGLYPSDISVRIEPLKSKNVKVVPSFVGDLPQGYKIKATSVEPSSIEVRGPESVVSKMEDVYTEMVDLNQVNKPTSRTVGLDPKYKDKIKDASQDKFTLYIDVVPFVVTQKFYGIKVNVVGAAGKYKTSANKVNVTVLGPKLLMEKFTVSDINATIDISFNAPGSADEDVVVKLPEGINLVSVEPKKINVVVER